MQIYPTKTSGSGRFFLDGGAPVLGFFVVFFFLFLDALLGFRDVIPGQDPEFITQWLPYRLFLRAAYRNGEFPLWCPNLMAGFPLAAFPHAAAFYPLNFFFYVLDYGPASSWYHFLHFLAASLLMYGLVRESGAGRFPSWLLALCYSFSGPIFSQMRAAHDFATCTWLPGLLWLSLASARRGKARHFLGLIFFCGLCYLAGNVEILLFSTVIFVAFVLFAERPPAGRSLVLAAAGAAAVLLVSLQLLPTAVYLAHSFRAEHHASSSPLFSTNIAFILLSLFFPTHPLYEGGQAAYLGLLLPLAFLLQPREEKELRRRRVFFFLGGLVVIFALNLWPFSILFNRLPLVGAFSAPGLRHRALYALLCLLGFLAGPGLTRLAEGQDRSFSRAGPVLFVFLAAQLIWLITGLVVHRPLGPVGLSRLIFLAGLGGFVLLLLRKRKKHPAAGWRVSGPALFIIFFLDLFTLDLAAMPRHRGPLFEPELSLSLFQRPLTPERVQPVSPVLIDPVMWKTLRLDRGPGFLFSAVRNGIRKVQEVMIRLNEGDPQFFRPDVVKERNRPLLNYLAVRHLLMRRKVGGMEYPSVEGEAYRELVNFDKMFVIYENRQALPLFGFYTSFRRLDDNSALAALFDPRTFDPTRDLILAPDSPVSALSSAPRPRQTGDVEVMEYGFSRVFLKTTAPSPGILSLARTYYPGFRAWVDGREAPIFRANYAFQAVALPEPGPHRVSLAFVPADFRIGLWVSLATLAVLILVFLRGAAPRNRPRRDVCAPPSGGV